MELLVLIGALAGVCGFLSGLLGIGGGIIMAPLLLYVPPLFGLGPLAMRTVAGLTILQGLVACIFGVVAHKKFNFVSARLTGWMGLTIFGAGRRGRGQVRLRAAAAADLRTPRLCGGTPDLRHAPRG
jgi:uncharacterized membrane protein YfcA